MTSAAFLLLVGATSAAIAVVSGWLSLQADHRTAEAGQKEPHRRRRRIPATGTVLAVATIAGAAGVGAQELDGRLVGLLGIAAALGTVGSICEQRSLRPSVRIAAEAVAGLAAVALGVRSGITGAAISNVALVVAFVVALVESFRLLDVGPRVAAAAVAPTATALGVVAAGTGQVGVAALAVGMAGGLAGLLLAGTGRTFALGEHGSLFGGFLLAVLVADLVPATPAPLSMVVVLPLVLLPLLNAVVVIIDRLRRRRPLTDRRPDGLPHRLRTIPLPWGVVLGVLGGSSALVGALVVLADHRVVSVAELLFGVALVSIGLLAASDEGKIHRHDAPGLSVGVRRIILVLGASAAVVSVVGGLGLMSVRRLVVQGAAAAERGLEEARRGEIDAAGSAFDRAQRSFVTASDRLNHPLATLGLAVPVVGANLSAVRTLSELGGELAGTGRAVTTAASNFTVSSGTVPIDEIGRLAADLVEASSTLDRARSVAAGLERSHLLPVVHDGLVRFDTRLEQASTEAALASEAALVLPAMLGGEGPRRYFLAIQNNAELRATGGLIGNYGELGAEGGVLRLDHLGRLSDLNKRGQPVRDVEAPQDYVDRYTPFDVARTWQNVNLSPDFPTVAKVIAGMYPQSGGQPVDGVIAVDPIGLSALLELTGPVSVESWPKPITAANVVDITLNQAYTSFGDERAERIDFLATVASACFDALRSTNLGSPARIAGALGSAARGGHLSLWFEQPAEQALIDRIGIAGRVDPVESDSLLVVNQNAGGNKIDYYFSRTTNFDVQLRPDVDRMAVSSRLRVDMHNTAPDGLPRYVIGPFDERFEAGENRTFVSLYTPLALVGATWDGAPVVMEAANELKRQVYSSFFTIPAGETKTLEVQLEGTVTPLSDGRYELDVLHQPILRPGTLTATFEVPEGWRIVELEGAELDGDRRAVVSFTPQQEESVRFRVTPQA